VPGFLVLKRESKINHSQNYQNYRLANELSI
jgi:hypothetical protein